MSRTNQILALRCNYLHKLYEKDNILF
uniref:Uncharacterized protein n=1 Tax=Anguilla anguilla TaxID=7936 RepID=A0A0E9XR11_ANGAN